MSNSQLGDDIIRYVQTHFIDLYNYNDTNITELIVNIMLEVGKQTDLSGQEKKELVIHIVSHFIPYIKLTKSSTDFIQFVLPNLIDTIYDIHIGKMYDWVAKRYSTLKRKGEDELQLLLNALDELPGVVDPIGQPELLKIICFSFLYMNLYLYLKFEEKKTIVFDAVKQLLQDRIAEFVVNDADIQLFIELVNNLQTGIFEDIGLLKSSCFSCLFSKCWKP